MATYVIGDIQGCYNALSRVLDKANFDQTRDKIWLVGDMVNRGGQSLQTIKLLYSIRNNLQVVLGNHDIYLMKCRYSTNNQSVEKELLQIIDHHKADKWFSWLHNLPLYYHDTQRNLLMVHAGLPHIWTLDQAMMLANEAQEAIAHNRNSLFWDNFFGNNPKRWCKNLYGIERIRCIVNYFTRMRYIDNSGKLCNNFTGKPLKGKFVNGNYHPWYSFRRTTEIDISIIFGHWAALKGKLHGHVAVNAIAMDTACVWHGKLTMRNIDTQQVFTAKQQRK